MSKNYYEILELNNYADETEIKKSYRRLALKWHPDKNPNNIEMATEKFNEISEAFEVLGDKQKRKQYDMFGNINYNQTPKQNPQDVFNHFFNDINQDTFFENILNSKMNSLNINNVNVRTNINTNTNTRFNVTMDVDSGQSYLIFLQSGDDTNWESIQVETTSTSYLEGTITYRTDS